MSYNVKSRSEYMKSFLFHILHVLIINVLLLTIDVSTFYLFYCNIGAARKLR
jgi:hypothetical protein